MLAQYSTRSGVVVRLGFDWPDRYCSSKMGMPIKFVNDSGSCGSLFLFAIEVPMLAESVSADSWAGTAIYAALKTFTETSGTTIPGRQLPNRNPTSAGFSVLGERQLFLELRPSR